MHQTAEQCIPVDIVTLADPRPYESNAGRWAIGRIERSDTTSSTPSGRVLVWAPTDIGPSTLPHSALIELPAELEDRRAFALPALVCALWAWEELRLELGDAALYTSALSPLERSLAAVAKWRGGAPIVRIGAAGSMSNEDAETVEISNPEQAVERLGNIARGSPGLAAIDLSGRADVLDVLFEALPRWGRLLLAAPATAPLTLDFYNNVHRKGVCLHGTRLSPELIVTPGQRSRFAPHIVRALRILANDELARSLVD